jgi:hypothetical protein
MLLVGAGGALIVLGLLAWSGALAWLGRLPGDLRVERPGFRLFVPITTMVLVSLLLTAVLAIVRRLR